jgi:SM-20-related protein
MEKVDTVGAADGMLQTGEAPASPDEGAVWELPGGMMCRVAGFLGPEVSGRLLGRAMAVPADGLRVSALSGGMIRRDARSSLTGDRFQAPELVEAMRDVLDAVERAVGVPCRDVVMDYTLAVHNDGDFYSPHRDSGPGSERLVTFVYYLHRAPRPFTGGQLRIFDAVAPADGASVPDDRRTWRDWEPDHDSIVFFHPGTLHEVRPVSCPSRAYTDSRFTVTGWFYPATPAAAG